MADEWEEGRKLEKRRRREEREVVVSEGESEEKVR
jgi:hypothetical protein